MEELYDFWKSNTNLWFNSTHEDDILLTNKYIYLFNNKYNINMTKKKWTGYVILYDQIIKHVNRCNNNIIQPDNFIENCYTKYNEFKDDINEFEFMFMLMPLAIALLTRSTEFIKAKKLIILAINILKCLKLVALSITKNCFHLSV